MSYLLRTQDERNVSEHHVQFHTFSGGELGKVAEALIGRPERTAWKLVEGPRGGIVLQKLTVSNRKVKTESTASRDILIDGVVVYSVRED